MAGMILQFDFGGRAPGGQPPVILVAVAVVVVVALVLLARRALSGVPTAGRRNRGDRDQWNRARRAYQPIPCDEPDGAGRGADG